MSASDQSLVELLEILNELRPSLATLRDILDTIVQRIRIDVSTIRPSNAQERIRKIRQRAVVVSREVAVWFSDAMMSKRMKLVMSQS